LIIWLREKKKNQTQSNEEILSFNVRLVGDNTENNISNTKRALQYAKSMGLDLVEISPKADPPVCKIIDYQKFLYNQKKKQKELKAKTTKVVCLNLVKVKMMKKKLIMILNLLKD
jgi:translation initiation factor IF-3